MDMQTALNNAVAKPNGVATMKAEVKAEAAAPAKTVEELMAEIESLKKPAPAKVAYVKPATAIETPAQELARLRAENEALKASKIRTSSISLKVSEKGGLSVYGLGRFPVTLYQEQWTKLIAAVPAIADYIKAHASELKLKGE